MEEKNSKQKFRTKLARNLIKYLHAIFQIHSYNDSTFIGIKSKDVWVYTCTSRGYHVAISRTKTTVTKDRCTVFRERFVIRNSGPYIQWCSDIPTTVMLVTRMVGD